MLKVKEWIRERGERRRRFDDSDGTDCDSEASVEIAVEDFSESAELIAGEMVDVADTSSLFWFWNYYKLVLLQDSKATGESSPPKVGGEDADSGRDVEGVSTSEVQVDTLEESSKTLSEEGSECPSVVRRARVKLLKFDRKVSAFPKEVIHLHNLVSCAHNGNTVMLYFRDGIKTTLKTKSESNALLWHKIIVRETMLEVATLGANLYYDHLNEILSTGDLVLFEIDQ